MMLIGLNGPSDCGSDQIWYPNLTFNGIKGMCASPVQAQAFLSSGNATGDLSTNGTQTSSSSGDSWWSTALTALTKGVTAGYVQHPATAPAVVVPPMPWYKTPIGIGAIVLGGLGAFLMLRK